MTRDGVQAWLDAYVAAWRSYEGIAELFTDDAEYRYHPYDEPLRGADAIAADWQREREDPESWDARYEAQLVGRPRGGDGRDALRRGPHVLEHLRPRLRRRRPLPVVHRVVHGAPALGANFRAWRLDVDICDVESPSTARSPRSPVLSTA